MTKEQARDAAMTKYLTSYLELKDAQFVARFVREQVEAAVKLRTLQIADYLEERHKGEIRLHGKLPKGICEYCDYVDQLRADAAEKPK